MADSPARILRLSAVPGENGRVEVIVADSGPGLAPEMSRTLFTPFTTTKASGMGVGLSISQTIVEGHGGRIWAGPSQWGGTAFHFTFDAEIGRASWKARVCRYVLITVGAVTL